MAGFKNRLKKMNEHWQTGKEYGSVPEAIYKMQLQAATLKESVSSGMLMIHREHLIIDGEFEGETVHDFMSLETDRGPFFADQWMSRMGYESPENAEDIETVLAEMVEAAPLYKGKVKTSEGGFTNVSVLKLLAAGEEGVPEEAVDAPDAEPGVEGAPEGFEVGGVVSFTDDDGNELSGVVLGPGDDAGTTQVSVDGEPWEVPDEKLSTVEVDAEPESEPEGDSAEDTRLAELVAFAQAQELQVSDADDIESLTATINKYSWPRDEMTEDEYTLLKDLGSDIKESIQEEPAPAPKAVKKTAKKAVKKTVAKKKAVKKAVKKTAKKAAKKKAGRTRR